MPDRHLKFHSTNGKRRVLVVEDEAINQELLGFILQDTYDIAFAATGAEALDDMRSNSETTSLVLLDLNLPDVHGLDVLRALKENPQSARIPVIVMTADKDAEVESLTLGAIDFIPKPYPQPKVVLARILRTIELSEDRDIIRWTERDHLTGLYNREYFYRYAAQYDVYHKETDTDAIIVDVNHFHMINERYGKQYGDEVLKQIGEQILESVVDANGIVCRNGADTFLIYCPHRSDYADILERASISLQQNGKSESRVRLRMGVYANADKAIDVEQRFDRAKLAADTVKNVFTKAIGLYDESLHESELFAEQLLEDFPIAIRDRQFKVFYQPKYDIRNDEPQLASAEALVRWQHPELGMISPGVFIPLFEKNGLIQELDSHIWQEAARQVRQWRDELGITLPISVNVSRVDLYDPDFAEKMLDLVQSYDIDAKELLLEITESAYVDDSAQIIEAAKQLRELGFRIEMDDFGTGYSSLNMISTLPVDALKLDMDFIRNAFRERKDTRLLEVVVRLAESLEVPTIAEGVETAEQLLTLKAMGCDIVQGYYFSRPISAEEFKTLLANEPLSTDPIEKSSKRRELKGPDQFTYDALHDPLTDLYNQTAFEILFHNSDKDHIAVLVAEIDQYPEILESRGQDFANRIVKRVADVLRSSFRTADDICRLKENEFVIIMTRVTSPLCTQVYDKVETVNGKLEHADGELVPVSLSVGVAFSDREKPEGDIFHDADTALNRMKEMRRCGCAVF